MTDRYAVMGNPIAHSKSPQIHAAFAVQTGQDLRYEALLIGEDEFAAQLAAFFAAGGKGLNITLPFKLDAWRLADVLSARARAARAVNTLMRGKDGKLYGDNTDGIGLVRDLIHQGVVLKDRKVLVLGAGGAVRGVIGMLLDQAPAQLCIANRTLARAREVAQSFFGQGSVEALAYEELAGQRFDLVINGTSASLQGELPPLPDDLLAPSAWCYDMMYGATETLFNRWGRVHGARCFDGLGMLVEQAAESFFIWRGVRPQTAPVIQALRAAMAA